MSARELEETRRILKDACIVGKAAILPNPASGTANAPKRAAPARIAAKGNALLADARSVEDNDPTDLPTVLPSTPPPSASYLHQQIDSLESSLFPEFTDPPIQQQQQQRQQQAQLTSKATQYYHSPRRPAA